MKKSFVFGSNAEMVVGWRCAVGRRRLVRRRRLDQWCAKSNCNRMCGTVAPVNPRHHHVNLVVDWFQFLALKKTIILRAAHVCEMVAKLLQNVGKS